MNNQKIYGAGRLGKLASFFVLLLQAQAQEFNLEIEFTSTKNRNQGEA